MSLMKHGQNTSEVEVSHVSRKGIWIDIQGKEYFLPFEEYPWFEDAKIKDIMNVQLLGDSHLCWPSLDLDLEVQCVENPQQYPLKYKP